MHRFWERLIKPAMVAVQPGTIVEIGSLTGLTTVKLLEYCRAVEGKCISIDPYPQYDVTVFKAFYKERFEVLEQLSLEALPQIDSCDMLFIDGDHNWYTVYHELKQAERIAKLQGRFPVIVLHDTQWPYGRRDMYYQPDNIPDEHRKPHAKRGIEPGQSELLEFGGFNCTVDNALFEKGERNGVLTAVEDFMQETEYPLQFKQALSNNGLGFLYPRDKKMDAIISYLIETSGL
ncbi:class I SAM-dependent methyltransferase [Paenibacillus sp. FJAT-26967]|uniref:class I SAM-dependent methyltransferase n=1 Tax=Paenibacillus sp. FJAT-26967 TaxID=1729690 RepID=UPI00083959EC|nr:class I SAM-dependent methyltransferase [Paenibacillus sp. FJAT-26967]